MSRLVRDFPPNRCYHLTSRTANRQLLFSDEDRTDLVSLLRTVSHTLQLELCSYCVMADQFSVQVFLPEATDGESISTFMKIVKQRFSTGYSKRHPDVRGTIWEGRFRCVQVEAACAPMAVIAAFDDWEPVMRTIVADPREYTWTGWCAALHGDKWARGFYMRIYGESKWERAARHHLDVMLDKGEYFRQAERVFTEGGAIGDTAFVEHYIRDYMSASHKGGAKMIPGGKSAWGVVRTAQLKHVKIYA